MNTLPRGVFLGGTFFYILHSAIVPIVCFCKCDGKLPTHHPEKSLIGEPLVLLNGRENTEDKADKHRHEPSRKRTTIIINSIKIPINMLNICFQRKPEWTKLILCMWMWMSGCHQMDGRLSNFSLGWASSDVRIKPMQPKLIR